MIKSFKLLTLLVIAAMTFSCQKQENVNPQKPVLTQTSQMVRSMEVELYPVGINKKVKFSTIGLIKNSAGRVTEGTLIEHTSLLTTAGSEAIFRRGKSVIFSQNGVNGVIYGYLSSSVGQAVLKVRGNGPAALELMPGTEVHLSNDPSGPGVQFGTLGLGQLLQNSDDSFTTYPRGTRVRFDRDGKVNNASLPD